MRWPRSMKALAWPRRMPDPALSQSTIGALLCRAGAVLRDAGIDDPRREARLLLAHALGRDPATLIAAAKQTAAPENFDALVARRAARVPLSQVLGEREFWSLRFRVTPDVLTPRPETETLIEAALATLPDRLAVARVLDLGTGSGCLLAAALTEFPRAFGIGVDRSAAALAVARGNVLALGLSGRAALLCADWHAPLADNFDLVLSNPPYIEQAAIAALAPEVATHEPRLALDGGADGLAAYRAILDGLAGKLAPGGVAVLELGAGQAGAVTAMAQRQGLAVQEIRPDLAAIPRALVLRQPSGFRGLE
jgi:release factor glutamine methyltransferase